ncbi:MAG: (Na+)-NQR maturation NqrM [Pseudomonadales bacterium]|jgi:hypothetical protein|nr:ApbE family protein [Oceanospirillaceae bacterium]HCI03028.1 ApbE family protein [Oceanospirillaceae bacterium]|tara:strand:+ start:2621 stop:2857 length:237 start_codon:yes stop_codon:yes gene_type:complete
METMILTFIILLILVAGMAIGVMMGRKPISGSCGGMSALGMDVACDICKGDPEVCETEQQKAIKAEQKATSLGYDASK